MDFVRIKTSALEGSYEEDGGKKKLLTKEKIFSNHVWQRIGFLNIWRILNSLENNPLGQKIWIDIWLKRIYRWQTHEKTSCIISH